MLVVNITEKTEKYFNVKIYENLNYKYDFDKYTNEVIQDLKKSNKLKTIFHDFDKGILIFQIYENSLYSFFRGIEIYQRMTYKHI